MRRWKKLLNLDKESLTVVLISCGDTGIEIGNGLINELKKNKVGVQSLAITTELESIRTTKQFDTTFKIKDSGDGFAKKLEKSISAVKKGKRKLTTEIRKMLGKSFDGLLLVTTGSGATGLGASTVVLDILDKTFEQYPPVLTLLPEVFENSRVQYNAATFLYETVFNQNKKSNPIILLDNKPGLKELDKPFSEVVNSRVKTIPIALADLLVASFEETITPEFDASVADLFDVIHTPGISVFVAETLGDESGNVDSSRIEDVISDSVIDSTSLTKDAVFEANRAFIAIFNIDEEGGKLSFQTEFETQKLFREFGNTNPYVKFIKHHNEEPKLRGIIAGLPVPTRILQIMRIARESRKRIMVEENQLQWHSVDFNENRIFELEDQLKSFFNMEEQVEKTKDEITETNSEIETDEIVDVESET